MAPPLSTAIPEACRTRESSKDSSGVPLDSNLCTKPDPGPAKTTLPSESAANVTGASSFPGPLPLSRHSPRNTNGGVCCGLGAGSVRLALNTALNAMNRVITRLAHRQLDEFEWAGRKVSGPGIVRCLRLNHTMRIGSHFRLGVEGIKATAGGFDAALESFNVKVKPAPGQAHRSIREEWNRNSASRRLVSGEQIPARAILYSARNWSKCRPARQQIGSP